MLLFLNFLIFLDQVLLFCYTTNSTFCLNTLFLLSFFWIRYRTTQLTAISYSNLWSTTKNDWIDLTFDRFAIAAFIQPQMTIDLTFKTIFLFRNRLQLVARPTLRQMPVQPAPMRRRRRKGMSAQSRRRRTPSQRRRLDVIQVFQRHFVISI